ncbi:MAG: glycosyltransferase [bacterium]|nr:glycosyltransferase [bacterium]
MRILIGILSELSHERRQERMALSLERAGHEVAATWVDNGTAPLSRFWRDRPLHRLENPRAGRRKAYFLRFMSWFHGLVLRERPDCVLAVDPPALLPAALARRRRPFRLVYDAREYYAELPTNRARPAVAAFWRWGEGHGMRRADASCAVCGSIARALAEEYRLPGVAVVRNLPVHSWREREAERRRPLGDLLPGLGGAAVVAYAGGFWPGYDFRPLQEAMGHLGGAGEAPPRLVYFGEGPGESFHRAHAAGLPWGGRIHFAGKVPPEHLEDLLRGADVGTVLVPDLGLSYRYLLPNKLFEYIQAGLPVLASPLPETASVVLGRQVGRCADPGDAAAIARQLEVLLDPARVAAWQGALRSAATDLCWEREEEAFLALFRKPEGPGGGSGAGTKQPGSPP